ncbi:MAG: mechanosensitive ion channel family protein [Acidimicrobiia bacterium]|nr:mechanosensitive ion channel family protein [Acidimicrobiia bacterium]
MTVLVLALSSTQTRLIWSAAVFVVVVIGRWLVTRWTCRRIADPELVFRTRKASTYVATLVLLLASGVIWVDRFDDVTTILGIFAAGLAVALGDVFLDLAGWVYIVMRHPFRTGDRIEIGDHAGDVVDVRVFRFSLLEIGNWVDADQHTGRIVHVPNGQLFRTAMANYTTGFHHIWHEVEVVITFDSDWHEAKEIIAGILAPYGESVHDMAESELAEASADYLLGRADIEPAVYVSTLANGVRLTGRVLIRATERRPIDSAIWSELLDAIAAEPTVELAYPTITLDNG